MQSFGINRCLLSGGKLFNKALCSSGFSRRKSDSRTISYALSLWYGFFSRNLRTNGQAPVIVFVAVVVPEITRRRIVVFLLCLSCAKLVFSFGDL